jgi:spore maturation protein CgeB
VKVFVFGSSLVSSYWNGAATYYRGIYKKLARLGHEITFAEPDAYQRQQHRDAGDFSYATSVVYRSPQDVSGLLRAASAADLVVKHSGVGVDDELLEREVLAYRSPRTQVAFWDVDAPVTLARAEADRANPFRGLIPQYDIIFTYGGGPAVLESYRRLGARESCAIYNGLDPESHHPIAPDPGLACDLALVANRLPDRERRIEQFFFRAAELAPELRFLLGGEGWGSRKLPANVRWLGHVATADHNRVNCSARIVLNVNRDSMADVGFSPPTRIFEAAGAGACVITDSWPGLEQFFAPAEEILVASSAEEVVAYLRNTSPDRARAIGAAMRQRALRDHTYDRRAREVDSVLRQARAEVAEVAG